MKGFETRRDCPRRAVLRGGGAPRFNPRVTDGAMAHRTTLPLNLHVIWK